MRGQSVMMPSCQLVVRARRDAHPAAALDLLGQQQQLWMCQCKREKREIDRHLQKPPIIAASRCALRSLQLSWPAQGALSLSLYMRDIHTLVLLLTAAHCFSQSEALSFSFTLSIVDRRFDSLILV